METHISRGECASACVFFISMFFGSVPSGLLEGWWSGLPEGFDLASIIIFILKSLKGASLYFGGSGTAHCVGSHAFCCPFCVQSTSGVTKCLFILGVLVKAPPQR